MWVLWRGGAGWLRARSRHIATMIEKRREVKNTYFQAKNGLCFDFALSLAWASWVEGGGQQPSEEADWSHQFSGILTMESRY